MIECSNLINVHNLSYLFFNIQREKKISLFYGKISMTFPSFVPIKVFIVINNYLSIQS